MTRWPLRPESWAALLNAQVEVSRYVPPRSRTVMSDFMDGVRLRTTACAASRLHGAEMLQPDVAVPVGDA
jgi:hypothetical protein